MIYNVNNELYYFMTATDRGWSDSMLAFLEEGYELQKDRVVFYPDVEFSDNANEIGEIEFFLRLVDKDDEELFYIVYRRSMIKWGEIRMCKEGVREFFGYYPFEIYLSKLRKEMKKDDLQRE